MSLKYRLLAVDVDGTLLNTRQEIPKANREASHRAHEAGMTVCLCTGRSLSETRQVIETLGLDSDVGIFVFGSIISRLPEGTTTHRTALPGPMADRIVSHFSGRGYPVLVLYDGSEAGVDYHLVEGERNTASYERWLSLIPATVTRLDRWSSPTFSPVRISIIDDPDNVEATLQALGGEFSPQEVKFNAIYAPNYRLHVVECFAPRVNKWYGIQRVAGPLGIDASQVVAIGDDVNDMEMIQQAGLGVAMGNAIPAIRQAARHIAPTNDEAGVARVVEAVLSGKWEAAA